MSLAVENSAKFKFPLRQAAGDVALPGLGWVAVTGSALIKLRVFCAGNVVPFITPSLVTKQALLTVQKFTGRAKRGYLHRLDHYVEKGVGAKSTRAQAQTRRGMPSGDNSSSERAGGNRGFQGASSSERPLSNRHGSKGNAPDPTSHSRFPRSSATSRSARDLVAGPVGDDTSSFSRAGRRGSERTKKDEFRVRRGARGAKREPEKIDGINIHYGGMSDFED